MIADYGSCSDPYMLDTRSNEWLSRLQGNGPRLVSLALAALIAVELARIAIALLGAGPVRSPQPVLTRAMPRSQRPATATAQPMSRWAVMIAPKRHPCSSVKCQFALDILCVWFLVTFDYLVERHEFNAHRIASR